MLIFDPYLGRPWWLLLLLPAGALTILSYRRISLRGLTGVRWKTPMALRLAAVLLCVLMAADFSVVTNLAPVYTVVALDLSDSMNGLSARSLEDARTIAQAAGGAALLFGGTAVPAGDLKDDADALREKHALAGDATDLGAALLRAESLFPLNARRRLILLSDGLETDGNALKQGAALAGGGARIDALAYAPWSEGGEVEIVSLTLPREMALGQTVKAAVTVRASAPAAIRLSLLDDEDPVYSNSLHISAGTADYTIQLTPARAGEHLIRAQVEAEEDTCAENNALSACLAVQSSEKILLVDGTGEESDALYDLLASLGYDVEIRAPKDLPPNTAALCKYGLVTLMNVDAQTLRSTAGAALSEYVQRFGGSLLLTGGVNSFAYGHLHETDLEEILPVSVQVEDQESAEPVALLLLIDNSASMGETGGALHGDFGRPIEMAKLGAIKSISMLHDNDYAGVISFSNKAHVLSPLRPASEREEIIATVSRLGLISGTMYTEALAEALNQFSAFEGPEKKHILFLSDGYPSDDDYMPVARRLADMGVTISTLSVGADLDAEILEKMALETGGRFVHANAVSDLPTLMSSDTLLQQVNYTVEGTFLPVVSPAIALFEQDALPELTGYIRVHPKSDADVPLRTEEGRPLYAQQHAGTGMTACFMSDLSGQWSAAWFREEAGQAAIRDLIAALLPEGMASPALDLALIPGGKEARLSLAMTDAPAGGSFEADVTGPGGDTIRARLPQTASGRYERTIPLMGFGRYDVTLRQYDGEGTLIETFETAVAASRSAEYEAFPGEVAQELLPALCDLTGGQVFHSAQDALAAPLDALTADVDPSGFLALGAALLFLAEQILRRVPVRRRPPS